MSARRSWADRYARYRRYGLEPLPPDATDEQRNERVAELKQLRRRRQRTLAIRSALGTVVIAALVVALLWWLLTTVGGRNVLLARIVAMLPANASLSWTSAEGPAKGPLSLHGVRFTWATCADKDRPVNAPFRICKDRRDTTFTAKTVTLDPSVRPLLGRKLLLDALDIEQATLDLAKDDKPFELPEWPEVLPRIEPPIALQADNIHINGLRVTSAGEPTIDIRRLRGGLRAETGRLALESVDVDSDRGRFHVDGVYAPKNNYATDLTATAVFPAAAGSTAGRLGLIARGDLETMDVFVGGRAPAPLRATLTLRAPDDSEDAQDNVRWSLVAKSEGLDPAVFTGERTDAELMTFDVVADGVGGSASLRGTWAQAANRVVIQPSKLRLEDKTLHAQPLVVDVLDGRVTLNGTGTFKQDMARFNFAANARGLRWSDAAGNTQVAGDGDFGVAGTREAWAVIGKAKLQRGEQRADVTLDGRGDARGLTIKNLVASMPEGRLSATGRVDVTPNTQWQLDARLAGFDPGYFLPDWPGAVNGRITTNGSIDARNRLSADVDVRDLGGRLRGRALGGRGQLQVRGEEYSGDVALSLGSSRLDARGKIGQRIDVDARFSPLQLNDLLPDAQGLLNGQVKITGPRNAFDIDADLTGRGIRYADYRADALTARGRLPWQGGGGDLRIDARGVQAGVAFDTLQAHATGAMENLRLEAQAAGAMGDLQLSGTALRRGQAWSGQLATLQFDPPKGAAWRLQAPVGYAQQGGAWTLTQGCFASNAGGQLCASGQWPGRGLNIRGSALPLALAQPWLPPREDGKAWQLDGLVDLDASVRPVGTSWAGTAQLRSASGGLRLGDRRTDGLMTYRALTLDARFDPNRISGTLATGISGDGRITARIDTGWDEFAPLSGNIDLDMRDLSWLEVFVPDLVDPSGVIDGQILLSGTRGNPGIGGNAQLANLRAEVPAYGLVLTQGNLTLRAQADGNARLAGSVRSGDGILNIDGTLGWRGQDTPVVLNIRGKNVLLSDTRDLRAVVDPDVVVSLQPGQPMRVTGTVAVPSARMDLERLDDGVTRSSDVVVLDPVNPKRSAGTALDMDLRLVIGDDVRLRGFGLDGQLGGGLRVLARPGREMTASGTLTVDGRYTAYGQKLQIDTGRLVWTNDAIANPVLDIRAQREVGDVTAGIRVSGRATAPQADVWANPAMDQSEALAYLALGRSLSSASADEGRQLNAASAALSAGGSLLASQLGAKIGLDDAGVIQSSTLGGSVFGVGKYLSPRLYVGYGVSLLGTGQVLTLKYLLRKGFDITIESSTVENKGSVNWRTER